MTTFENIPVLNNFEVNKLLGRATVDVYPVTEVLPNGAIHIEMVIHDHGMYVFFRDFDLQSLSIALNASAVKAEEDKSDPEYLPTFLALVSEERNRQRAKGYNEEHDDREGHEHLLWVAQTYILNGEMVKAYAVMEALKQHLARRTIT